MWPSLRWLLVGATVVLLPAFDPVQVWKLVARERVNVMNVVGEAMARPLADALPAAGAADLGSLEVIASGGAPLTRETKARLLDALPGVIIKDTFGSTETGVQGWSMHDGESDRASRFRTVDTVVLDPETRRELPPGGGPGIVARRDRVPLRYHGYTAATAATFIEIAGRRHVLTGDLGRLEADGTLTLLGRGSQCINSGGEKIHPEEVEEVLRRHPAVYDTIVLGAHDPRWGQQVVALVHPVAGKAVDEAEVRSHCRAALAPYKVPKRVLVVDQVVRTAVGKADYAWASAVVTTAMNREGAQ
jgi:acyl-CoA synthetase (AMP-forming)/AMP-acid ligase II